LHHYLCCLEFSLKFRLLVFVISSVSLRHFKISPVSLTPLLSLLSRTLSLIIYDVSNRAIIISDVSRGQFVISTVSFALICNLYCLPVPFCNLSCLTVRFCNLCCLVALYIPISCVPHHPPRYCLFRSAIYSYLLCTTSPSTGAHSGCALFADCGESLFEAMYDDEIYRALVICRVSLTSAVRISSVTLSRNCNSNIANFFKISSQLSHFLVILISPVSRNFR
jgi:hypothetical protein